MPDDLPFGLYERLLTASLKAKVLEFRASKGHADTVHLDKAEASATLARHVEGVVSRALADLPADGRAEKQVEVANSILNLLDADVNALAIPPEVLMAIRPNAERPCNLVGAATGTGKTIVAALDFKRLQQERGDLRLLFVAHTREILRQSLGAFRSVMRDGSMSTMAADGGR